mmetsp:Transcript_34844/g.84677  ORF Transcript_34844/g.84677 Transcript_34844/m.84677 type:complete len:81 (+) Transcript_34844:62-304(+)
MYFWGLGHQLFWALGHGLRRSFGDLVVTRAAHYKVARNSKPCTTPDSCAASSANSFSQYDHHVTIVRFHSITDDAASTCA